MRLLPGTEWKYWLEDEKYGSLQMNYRVEKGAALIKNRRRSRL